MEVPKMDGLQWKIQKKWWFFGVPQFQETFKSSIFIGVFQQTSHPATGVHPFNPIYGIPRHWQNGIFIINKHWPISWPAFSGGAPPQVPYPPGVMVSFPAAWPNNPMKPPKSSCWEIKFGEHQFNIYIICIYILCIYIYHLTINYWDHLIICN